MNLRFLPLFLVLIAATFLAGNAGQECAPGWCQDFRTISTDWEVRGKPGVPNATFEVAQPQGCTTSCLVMKADKASASLLMEVGSVDLRKTPILRWRWRVIEFPKNADGRDPGRDDQAIGIYVNSGSMFNQKSIAYRWETDTPVGATGMVTYAAGMVKVKWFSLRNRNDGDGKTFFIEARNVAEDFKQAFGSLPGKIGIGISCNSQYTASRAQANLDWIELIPPSTNTAVTTAKH